MKHLFIKISFSLLAPVAAISQQQSVQSFPLQSVRLLESPFQQAQQTDLKYILALDADRLLAPYLREAGITPKAAPYGNWENTGLDGHIGGHYVSALANMYAATGNAEIKKRLDYMLDWLEKCQVQNGNGYLGGVPGSKQLWQDIAAGKINAGSFSLNDKWVPWYNIHKMFAGLADVYRQTGNEKAKIMLVRFSDWCANLVANLSDQQLQNMLRSEHGGMNEVFADVAHFTGNKKYLELARRFSHQRVLQPLLQQKDSLTGMHANTQIPKVIGYMRVAEVDGNKEWAAAANYFWQTVVHNRTVSIGGNSVREHFHPASDFSSMVDSKEGPETCNTYNMLKLTKQLFLQQPSAAYMDYYERAQYNHILSSQHPNGGFVYFTPMRPRHYRVYSQPQEGFWCCVGSGLENHTKYGELIYAHNDKDLFVNLFIPSTLQWKERGISLSQQTAFPSEEKTSIRITIQKPQQFALHLRQPSWIKGAMKVLVNGKAVTGKLDATSSYLAVNRQWKTGDVVTVMLPMQTKAEKLPDGSPWVSFVHGPVVLAAATDTTNLQGIWADNSRMGHIANGPLYPADDAPLLVTNNTDVAAALKPVPGKPLHFTASGLIHPEQYKSLQLVPFYTVHEARYMVYWPLTTPEGLAKRTEAIRERERARLQLESITIDQVAPGEQQPESDHNFKGEQTESGVFQDRHWRHASGWFSYDLKNKGGQGRTLRITYASGDRNRTFDIFINGQLLQTVRLEGRQQQGFYDVDYAIPAALLQNLANETMAVKFAAHPGSMAGGIFYVRLLK
ncbi:glycoside hydrolase family 127 protein [Paracnuella aquatica]|uniref:glycoside hydrolase family 127 protein n=1 Tax=Paracnuella aquatica TaxID=2268757 RepID=UPI000DEFBAE1|nr:glycoside hydrolase family 127 protein [Paracnuella aquatica]RPD46758.1 glycosyl hydrolase [Paracnuella aquatica]